LKLGEALFVAEDMEEEQACAVGLPRALGPGVFQHVRDPKEVRRGEVGGNPTGVKGSASEGGTPDAEPVTGQAVGPEEGGKRSKAWAVRGGGWGARRGGERGTEATWGRRLVSCGSPVL
jgi:hypothetical protein